MLGMKGRLNAPVATTIALEENSVPFSERSRNPPLSRYTRTMRMFWLHRQFEMLAVLLQVLHYFVASRVR
jgi:hypothetical protein